VRNQQQEQLNQRNMSLFLKQSGKSYQYITLSSIFSWILRILLSRHGDYDVHGFSFHDHVRDCGHDHGYDHENDHASESDRLHSHREPKQSSKINHPFQH
jgi:hypothetical protein